jgi:hypothetical protein
MERLHIHYRHGPKAYLMEEILGEEVKLHVFHGVISPRQITFGLYYFFLRCALLLESG